MDQFQRNADDQLEDQVEDEMHVPGGDIAMA